MTPLYTKNGKRLIGSRYRKIVVDGRKVDEHRYIMEQHLGRKLERREEVHHINEDTHDNRLENLKLVTKSEHFKIHLPSMRRRAWTLADRAVYRERFSGERAHFAKLTMEQAREIRRRCAAGESMRALAVEYGIARSGIVNIKNNKSYREAQLRVVDLGF